MSYFKKEEFTCKCGCGFNCISHELVAKLEAARMGVGRVIIINSGCRCRAHNLAVGGSEMSSHMFGTAVDIRTPADDDEYRWLLVTALIFVGIKRIGIRKDFIHVDVSPTKSNNRMWIY